MALLKGKTAVITGGSTGVGLATAKRFAEEGAYVFINGRSQAELDAAVREMLVGTLALMAWLLRASFKAEDRQHLAELNEEYKELLQHQGRQDW
jgi:NAD(P)-dependent dehydrogenase (short-subunit alcohol dehydrogenase family)